MLLFVYDTLLDEDVRRLLLNKDVPANKYVLMGFEKRVGMDGFSYIVENVNLNVEGALIQVSGSECLVFDFWLAQLYSKFVISDNVYNKPIFFYTYKDYKELSKQGQPDYVKKFLQISHADAVELATDFADYYYNKLGFGTKGV